MTTSTEILLRAGMAAGKTRTIRHWQQTASADLVARTHIYEGLPGRDDRPDALTAYLNGPEAAIVLEGLLASALAVGGTTWNRVVTISPAPRSTWGHVRSYEKKHGPVRDLPEWKGQA